jgi:hypothetical protein
VISRTPHRDLSLLLSFIALVFASASHPLSCVWVANVRPAVVLFYNPALLVLRLIWFPSVLCRTAAPTEHHLYLIVPASGSHLVSAFSYYHHPVIVCSVSPCSRFIVCAYYFFDPFRCEYFLSDPFLLPLFIFPPCPLFPLILCYLTRIHSRNC